MLFSKDAQGASDPIVNVDSGLPNCRAGLDRLKTINSELNEASEVVRGWTSLSQNMVKIDSVL